VEAVVAAMRAHPQSVQVGVFTRSLLSFKLSVGLTGQVYLLEIEGLFTQGSRPGRTVSAVGLVGLM
jgi:hypothetical protein